MYLFVILHYIYVHVHVWLYNVCVYIFNIIILCMGTLYVGVYAHVQRCRTYATSLRPQCSSFTISMGLPSGKLTSLRKITIFNGKTHYKWPFSIAMLNWGQPSYRCDAAIDLPGFDILLHIFLKNISCLQTSGQPNQATSGSREPPRWPRSRFALGIGMSLGWGIQSGSR